MGAINMITYCCEFEMDGRRYCQNIEAENGDDAEKRVAAIRESMTLLGELGGSIPATDEEAFASVAEQNSRRPRLKIVDESFLRDREA
jgi:hypothetical protein